MTTEPMEFQVLTVLAPCLDPIMNNIWYMEKGRFCWEGIQNDTVMLSNSPPPLSFNCPFTSPTGIRCHTQTAGQIKLSSTDKSYSNLDIKDQSFLELELAAPREVIAVEPNWPEERL